MMVTNLKLLNHDSLERVDVTLYRHIVGSLMYLTNKIPYICFVFNILSQYMVDPRHVHLVPTKHVMRYFKGTLNYGHRNTANSEFRLCGYTDSDWAVLQLQQFPKIPKIFRTLLSLGLAWFYALIWSGSFQKGFLMLIWFTTYLHLPLTLESFPFLSSLIVIF